MESEPTPSGTAAEDLAMIGATRRALEPPRRFSMLYDLIFSLTSGAMVAALALPWSIGIWVLLGALLVLGILMGWWRRRLGWWVNGYAPRRARWVSIALVVALLGLALWAWSMPEPWVALVAGGAGALTAFIGSRLWIGVWRHERESVRAG